MATRSSSFTTNNPDVARVMAQRLATPNWAPKPKFPGVSNGHTIGVDNRSGKPIVKPDGGHAIKVSVNKFGVYVNGQQAEINHDNSAPGSRVVVSRFGVNIITQGGVGNTSNKEDKNDLDRCNDLGGDFGDSGQPEEPDEPEEPQPPPPLPAPGPDDPEEPDEPEPPGEGCRPDDDCQWYNSPNGNSSNCPTGTTYKGFAELSGGNFKVLCCGENRPAGDGCPDDPDTYGWQCVNGTCEQLPAGIYATKVECEQDCNQDEPCLPWVCENDTCTFVGCGGTYATLGECEQDCGPQ